VNWKDKLKEINQFNFKDKFFPKYKFNKWIFRTGILIIFVALMYLLVVNNFDFSVEYTASCPIESIAPCSNPFYGADVDVLRFCPDDALCSKPVIFPGENYNPRGLNNTTRFFKYFVLIISVLCLLINHLIYNRRSLKNGDK